MGWSDDDPPLEFSDDDGNEFSVGADGGLYAIGNPQFGTEMTFKVFPNSPTVQWAINQEQMRKDDLAGGQRSGDLRRQLHQSCNGRFVPIVRRVHYELPVHAGAGRYLRRHHEV